MKCKEEADRESEINTRERKKKKKKKKGRRRGRQGASVLHALSGACFVLNHFHCLRARMRGLSFSIAPLDTFLLAFYFLFRNLLFKM